MQTAIAATDSQIRGLQEQYEATTHNIANVTTAGYKRRITSFSALLAKQLAGTAGASTGQAYEALGMRVAAETNVDFSQGPVTSTGRALDVALFGDGFLMVETPAGPLYTRHGSLRVNDAGQLTDAQGRLLAGRDGPLVLPPDVPLNEVGISPSGEVQAGGETLGTLRVMTFADKNVLQPAGATSLSAPDAVRPKDATGVTLRQRHLEQSNVNSMEEMVNLVTVSRMYEANMKSVHMQDQRVRSLLQVAMS